MGRARLKKGEGRVWFPIWEENPRELWVGIIRGLSVGIITENYERERERWKAHRVNPILRLMLSPNYGTRACKKGRGTHTVPSLRGKSSGIMSEIIRGLWVGIMSGNYEWELSSEYQWELSLRIMRERERERCAE